MQIETMQEVRIQMIQNLIDALIDASKKGNDTEFFREQIIYLSK